METDALIALEDRVAKLEAKSSFDIKAYLPELRSIIWALSGLVAGGGATWIAKPTPAPVEKEVVVNPGQVKAQMEKK